MNRLQRLLSRIFPGTPKPDYPPISKQYEYVEIQRKAKTVQQRLIEELQRTEQLLRNKSERENVG